MYSSATAVVEVVLCWSELHQSLTSFARPTCVVWTLMRCTLMIGECGCSVIPDFVHVFETDIKQQWRTDTQEPMAIRENMN